MNPDSFCRLCARSFESKLDDDLFSKFNKSLLHQVKELTGITLKSISRQNLPRHICSTCKQDLFKAYGFRYGVLKAQTYFKSKDYKEKIENSSAESAQMFDTVFLTVKTESDEVEAERRVGTNESEDEKDEFELKLASDGHKQSQDEKIKVDLKPCQIDGEPNMVNVPNNVQINIEPHIKVENDFECTNSEDDFDNMEEDPCFEAFAARSSDDCDFKKTKKSTKSKKPKQPKKTKKIRKPKEKKRKPPGEKLYKCHHCDLEFKRPNTRTKHERLFHGKDWPFQCEECGKKFTTHDAGRNHMVVHTKIRNFHCTICNASFLLKKHLNTHYRSETHKNNESKLRVLSGSEQEIAPNETSVNSQQLLTDIQSTEQSTRRSIPEFVAKNCLNTLKKKAQQIPSSEESPSINYQHITQGLQQQQQQPPEISAAFSVSKVYKLN